MICEDFNNRNRRSIRLAGYDYSQAGYYFVTICAQEEGNVFGKIVNGEMVLNDAGKTIETNWKKLPQRFPNIELDEFIIMPNHTHMIITVGAGLSRPLNIECEDRNIGRGNPAPTLGQIVAYFKYGTTKQINELRNAGIKKIWQRNYYEHVIRDDNDLNRIREYIVNNPAKWEEDEYYVDNYWAGKPRPYGSVIDEREKTKA